MTNQSRYSLAKISIFGITQLQHQSPYMVAWWSAVFPGFGHYLLNQYLRATLLTLSEVITNTLAHINEAIIYSFCGKFELAKLIIEPRWAFGYLAIYLIAIWDSYRSAVYQNKLYQLAYLENSVIPNFGLFSNGLQYLEKRRPLTGVIYSFFFPGLGQLYIHRFGLAFYAMFWWWFYLSLSNLHEAVVTLVLGSIQESTSILRPHWFLFMPSVMGGSIYHSYITSIEHNRLFRIEQRQQLAIRYRNTKFRIFS